MTGSAAAPLLLVDPEDALRARSAAVGELIFVGTLTLTEAADRLRDLAERFDALTGRLFPTPNNCNVCGCSPCQTPAFCAASRAADADPIVQLNRKNATAATVDLPSWWDDDGVSPERLAGWFADRHRKAGASQATVNAAMYALRRDGLPGLPAQRERLREMSPKQIDELIERLHRAGTTEEVLTAIVRFSR